MDGGAHTLYLAPSYTDAVPEGEVPYRLGFPASAHQMISNIHPTRGINHSSCSHPLRSVSCRRRAVTAIPGRNVAIENNPDKL